MRTASIEDSAIDAPPLSAHPTNSARRAKASGRVGKGRKAVPTRFYRHAPTRGAVIDFISAWARCALPTLQDARDDERHSAFHAFLNFTAPIALPP